MAGPARALGAGAAGGTGVRPGFDGLCGHRSQDGPDLRVSQVGARRLRGGGGALQGTAAGAAPLPAGTPARGRHARRRGGRPGHNRAFSAGARAAPPRPRPARGQNPLVVLPSAECVAIEPGWLGPFAWLRPLADAFGRLHVSFHWLAQGLETPVPSLKSWRDHPAPTLAALGLLSGVLSAIVGFEVRLDVLD